MIARRAGRMILLAAAFGLATWLVGWRGVPAVAAAWGAVGWRRRGTAADSALAAALAWTALLAMVAARGDLLAFAGRLGGIFQLPGHAVILATLLFAAALAWSAATVAIALVRAIERVRRGDPAPADGRTVTPLVRWS